MPAILNTSANFSDIEAVAEDLLIGIETVSHTGSLGFLTCDSQIEYSAVLKLLSGRVSFPIVGGTTFTYPLASVNDEISAALTVITINNMSVSVAITPPLDESDSEGQVNAVYNECLAGLDGKPEMFMLFMPTIAGFAADPHISRLFAIAGGIPVFGGLTTDDLDASQAAVFANGTAYTDRMLLVGLGGSIRPVFSVGNSLTLMSEYAPAVTASEQNIVREVDGMTFCDYMRSLGISPEARINGVDALMQYGPLPAQLKNKLDDDDGLPELRCISYTNVDEGSAAFSSSMPVGTRLNIGVIHKDDVLRSAKECITSLAGRMAEHEKNGYHYSMLLSIPCVARYFAAGGQSAEGSVLMDAVPSGLPLASLYGFCEIGPTYREAGSVHNRSHNASIVMLAI